MWLLSLNKLPGIIHFNTALDVLVHPLPVQKVLDMGLIFVMPMCPLYNTHNIMLQRHGGIRSTLQQRMIPSLTVRSSLKDQYR